MAMDSGDFAFACPNCSEQITRPARALANTAAFFCPKCNSMLELNAVRSNKKAHRASIKATVKDGTSHRFEVVARSDGVWLFNDPNEAVVTESLELDSDRAAAIIGGSMVEARLEAALRARLPNERHAKKLAGEIFRPSGPLGPFSNKIDLAFLMGMLTEQGYRDLVTLKNIRNKFAHNLEIRDFNAQSLSALCKNLLLIETLVGDHEENDTIIDFGLAKRPLLRVHGYKRRRDVPRDRYLMAVQLFLVVLGVGIVSTELSPLV